MICADLNQNRRMCCAVLVCFLLVTVCAGCATYMPVSRSYRHRGARLEVELPKNWLRFTPARSDYVMTRDGLRLEKISIHCTRLDKKLHGTERAYRAGMLPHEVAELSLGLIESSGKNTDFQVEVVDLARVGGYPGYKAYAIFTDQAGLRKRLCLYGAVMEEYVCEFRYEAAEECYFDKYLSIFEELVTSARSI